MCACNEFVQTPVALFKHSTREPSQASFLHLTRAYTNTQTDTMQWGTGAFAYLLCLQIWKFIKYNNNIRHFFLPFYSHGMASLHTRARIPAHSLTYIKQTAAFLHRHTHISSSYLPPSSVFPLRRTSGLARGSPVCCELPALHFPSASQK